MGRDGRLWRSLVFENVVEPALGPEQLAAGLIVGDPVLQVSRQLWGLHLQREMGVRPDPDSAAAQPSPRGWVTPHQPFSMQIPGTGLSLTHAKPDTAPGALCPIWDRTSTGCPCQAG